MLAIKTVTWDDLEPRFSALLEAPLTPDNVANWLANWTRLAEEVDEAYSRLYIATTQDTTDEDLEQTFKTFLENVYSHVEKAEQQLKQKLLNSGLEPAGFKLPLRRMRAAADLFREKNLPLLNAERKVVFQFNRAMGAMTVPWEGEERTLQQMENVLLDGDRAVRERAWRATSQRWLDNSETVNECWGQFMDVRRQIAANAGFDSYRDYRWQHLNRFAYTPEDCKTFHAAIEEVVVPAARRIYTRRQARLGVETLRPWDLAVDPTGKPALHPFDTVAQLVQTGSAIFHQVDAQLGGYFDTMRTEDLLDLENRKGKGPGAYSGGLEVSKRPFIFMNATGHFGDVRTLLHEAGHAFHAFEAFELPYLPQREVPMEFAEVASMAMELLAAPYLMKDQGGFYDEADYRRARTQHLEKIVLFWPYMAVVDAFQHWVYENHDAASDPANCDAQWAALWDRFMVGIDYSGLEPDKANGWHRKRHIHRTPFYYVEYGLAQLGAVLVWRNALQDPAGALAAYRHALALGGTVSLPDLYEAAGVQFTFEAGGLSEAINLIEAQLAEFDPA